MPERDGIYRCMLAGRGGVNGEEILIIRYVLVSR